MMKREVLQCYRTLLRTCQNVFHGDRPNYSLARAMAREEFLKNKGLEDQQAIAQMISEGYEAEKFLRENVVQLKPTGENSYRLMLTEDKVLEDNLRPPPPPPPPPPIPPRSAESSVGSGEKPEL